MAAKVQRPPLAEIERRLAELNDMLFPAESGLGLAFVELDELREQDLNARSMSPEMFAQLTTNIANVKTLESVPLCARTERGVEIVSGHHRLRAAREAGIQHLLVLVYQGLSSSQIRGKQLAHNSIQGQDDPQMLKRIFEQIEDVSAQMEAFIDPKVFETIPEPVEFSPVDVDPLADLRQVTIAFLPVQKADFDQAMLALMVEADQVYLAHREAFDAFQEALKRIRRELDIRSAPTAVAEMARLALKALEREGEEEVGDE